MTGFEDQVAPPSADTTTSEIPEPPSKAHWFGTTEGEADLHYGMGWGTRTAVKEAAEGAGRDPGSVTICVAAPAYVGDDLVHARDQCRWFGGIQSSQPDASMIRAAKP